MFGPNQIRFLPVLALSFLLGLPGLVMADHLHAPAGEEISCEICSHSSSPATAESTHCVQVAPEPQQVERHEDFFLPETRRFHHHQRGPPLLR